MKAGRLSAVVIALVLGPGPSCALAQQAPQPETRAVSKGLVVFVDPVTGKIRQPDASEIGALVSPRPAPGDAAPLAEKPLEMRFGPGGAVGVVLDERFESFMVVTKAPGGKLAMDCVEGRKKAEAAVAANPRLAKPAEPARKPDGKESPDVR